MSIKSSLSKSELHDESVSLILKSSFIIIIGTFFGRFLGVINQSLLARILGPSDYGLLALAMVFIQLSNAFIFLGLRSGIIRYISVYNSQGDEKGIRSVIFQTLAIVFIMNLLLINLHLFFFKDILMSYFSSNEINLLLLALPLYSFFYVFYAVCRAFKYTKYNVFSEALLKKVIRIIVFMVLYYAFGFKFFGALSALLIALILTTIYIVFIVNNKIVSMKSVFFGSRRNEFRNLMSYSLPLTFSTLILLIFNQVDILSLAYFKTTYHVGHYAASLTVASFIGLIPGTFTYMFFPKITELYNSDKKSEAKDTFSTLTKLYMISSLMIFFMIIANGRLILDLIFGSQFLDSFPILVVLGFGIFVAYATGPTGSILNAADKTVLTMRCDIIGALVKLLTCIPLLLFFGTIGVAISTALSMTIRNTLSVYYVKRNLGIFPFELPFLLTIFKVSLGLFLIILEQYLYGFITIITFLLSMVLFFYLVFSTWNSNFFTNGEKTILYNNMTGLMKRIWLK